MSVLVHVRLLQRRRTAAAWTSINEILLDGEMGLETDTRKFKFGDGVTDWNSLAYAAPDLTGALLTSQLDTDGTLAANSDAKVPSQKAVKTYVDMAVTGLLDFKGNTNCSGNPNYPAALKGDAYVVSAAGKIGGASGVSVDIGDVFVASADNAGGTQAAVGASWFVMEHNLAGALLTSDLGVTVQAYSALLTALAAVGTNGLLARTGSGTAAARTITGTSAEISVSNGDGASGNPTLSFPSAVNLNGKTFTLEGATFPRLRLLRTGTAEWFVGNPTAGGTTNGFAITLNSTAVIEFFSDFGIAMANLPTYATNAAAVSGGLAVNRLYKTATGEVRIVV